MAANTKGVRSRLGEAIPEDHLVRIDQIGNE